MSPLASHPSSSAGTLGLPWDAGTVNGIFAELEHIRAQMIEAEAKRAVQIRAMQPTYRESARNLLHYMALRRNDVRRLQEDLAAMGLSSLGRSESHVLANLDAVLAILGHLGASPTGSPPPDAPALTFDEGKKLLEAHTEALLGPRPAGRAVRIMVTMPTEAAGNPDLVQDLVAGGMDVMRINCAHDDAEAWARMISHLARARQRLGRECRILMDVAGPKLRTGPIEPGPRVLKWRPRRDATGGVTAPARIWLFPAGGRTSPSSPADVALPVPEPWLARLQAGDRVELTDLRGKTRRVLIAGRQEGGCWGECVQTAYVGPGTLLRLRGAPGGEKREETHEAQLGDLPPLTQPILLTPGDTLVLTRALTPGRPALRDEAGQTVEPARIGCTLPEVFTQVKPGERIWFDDGKLGGTVAAVEDDRLEVKIAHASERGTRLWADRGINLPETKLALPPLTPKDLEDLCFIAAHADLLGLSFVRRAEDVREVESRLAKMAERAIGLILKIETRQGFEQLPQLLFAAFASRPVGVMIARGDLAVECGYERLAEVQEEILWVCEAAHVPVVWATQVLESLTKKGMPSRAEISDAAMAGRAECVMLNKGPHIAEAVRALDDILVRMQAHQRKKSSRLRSLRLSEILR